MHALSRTWRQKRCRHLVTRSLRSAGVERVICESCGHVSMHVSDLDGQIERASFARPIERDPDQSPGRRAPFA